MILVPTAPKCPSLKSENAIQIPRKRNKKGPGQDATPERPRKTRTKGGLRNDVLGREKTKQEKPEGEPGPNTAYAGQKAPDQTENRGTDRGNHSLS